MFIYESEDEGYAYVYTLKKEKNIEETKILDKIGTISKIQKMLIELFTGFDGTYYRMVGTTNLKVYKNGSLLEEYTNGPSLFYRFVKIRISPLYFAMTFSGSF